MVVASKEKLYWLPCLAVPESDGTVLAAGCEGLARVDFFLRADGQYFMNEINPFPGFTEFSAYPLSWKSKGVTAFSLLNELIVSAFYRKRLQNRLMG